MASRKVTPPPEIGDDKPPADLTEIAGQAGKGGEDKPTAKATPSPRPRSTALDKLEQKMAAEFAAVGVAVCFVNQYDGQVVIAGAPNLAAALRNLAEQNSRIRAALEAGLGLSAWLQLAVAAGMIAAPIMAHHGITPSVPILTPTEVPIPDATANGKQPRDIESVLG